MTQADFEIGRDTLIALAAVAWADGSISAAEAAGLRRTAGQLGLPPDELSAVERSLEVRVEVADVETLRMSRLGRLFTYAAATWMAELDGSSRPEEQAVLDALGDRLGLSSVSRQRARDGALAIGRASGDDPNAYDLVALRSRMSASLSQVGDA